MKTIRNPHTLKCIASFLLVLFLSQVFSPTLSWAVGGGAQQVDTAGPSEVSQQLVDPFTGDFSYAIPLVDVGGYPLNLNYNANVGMEGDASWVGLGWSLNPGAITRSMRGLPDDFKGDTVIQNTFLKPHEYEAKRDAKEDNVGPKTLASAGGGSSTGASIGFSLGTSQSSGTHVGYSNYTGWDVAKFGSHSFNATVSAGIGGLLGISLGVTPGRSYETGSKTGIAINPSMSYSAQALIGVKTFGGALGIASSVLLR